MATLSDIKKDIDFYKNFSSLIEALKAITISQYHNLEKKLKLADDFINLLGNFFSSLDAASIQHPFVKPKTDLPMGVVAITSDAGLLGGLNNRIITTALNYLRDKENKLIVVGSQGQRFARGFGLSFKEFPGIDDKRSLSQALELRDYIVKEALGKRVGIVKVVYPFAPSMTIQKVVELNLLPCTEWPKDASAKDNAPRGGIEVAGIESDIILESSPNDIIEYLVYLWVGQRLYEILQLSRLAEYAARVIHLEESSQRLKEIEQKLRLQYFRERHEVIDQQMRELFSARSLYVK